MITGLWRAMMSALREGPVQTVKVQVFDDMGRVQVERHQDYGFAAAPANGEGIVIECDGHMVVLRIDQVDGRPELQANEVSVWHRDGHKITLKAGRVIDVECDTYNVKTKQYNVQATYSATIDTPTMTVTNMIQSQNLNVSGTSVIDGIDIGAHTHGGVENGGDHTSGPDK